MPLAPDSGGLFSDHRFTTMSPLRAGFCDPARRVVLVRTVKATVPRGRAHTAYSRISLATEYVGRSPRSGEQLRTSDVGSPFKSRSRRCLQMTAPRPVRPAASVERAAGIRQTAALATVQSPMPTSPSSHREPRPDAVIEHTASGRPTSISSRRTALEDAWAANEASSLKSDAHGSQSGDDGLC